MKITVIAFLSKLFLKNIDILRHWLDILLKTVKHFKKEGFLAQFNMFLSSTSK